MLRFTARSMLARRRRVLLTLLIASVGVAIVTGALVFTDTVNSSLHGLYAEASGGAQLVVAPRQAIAASPAPSASVSSGLLARITNLQNVSAAAGQISDVATVLGRDGHVLPNGRLPTLALSYLPPPFRSVSIIRGSAPFGAGQVAIDPATAAQAGYRVGEHIPVVTGQAVRSFRITGIAGFGAGAVAGQRLVVFDPHTAQSLYGKTGGYDVVDVALVPGASARRVREAIQRLLPPGLVARPRQAQANAQVRQVSTRLASLTTGLFAFAAIAAVVGALLVFNSFAASQTRRAGELALLRALGATRRQILTANLVEALMVGSAAFLLGLALGPLAALIINALFDPSPVGLAHGLTLRADTVVIAAVVGIGVAALSALLPAVRAARAAPLEAIRTAAAPKRLRDATGRAIVAAALGLGGLVLILTAGGAAPQRLRISAIGGAIVIAAALLAGPLLVRGLAQPMSWLVERRDPVAGRLAREQSLQNPGRTAVSASSLTIGLALVVVVATYAGAVRAAARTAVDQTFIGDVVVENQDGVSTIPPAVAQVAGQAPGVVALSGLRTARADLGSGSAVQVNGIDPVSWADIYRFEWVHGSRRLLQQLGVGSVLVEQDTARAAHLIKGQHTTLVAASGRRVPVTVQGIYRDAGLLHGVVVAAPWFAQLFSQPRLQALFVQLAPGPARRTSLSALRTGLRRFPGVVARSQTQLAAEVQGGVSSSVDLLYGLLALSLVMSLVGIAATLDLSVHERTRELGVLRALGMSAVQARSLVRSESMIAAAVGLLTGIVLGLVLGWAVTSALSAQGLGFAVPWLAVLAVLLVGGLAGALAAVAPGRRVLRLDVLAAIAYE